MAEGGSNWISEVRWDEQGRPYRLVLQNTASLRAGQRTYVSPGEVNPQNTSDVRLLQWAQKNSQPGGSLLQERGRWNPTEGKWDRPTNWGNVANMGVGAFLAGPAIASALGSGAPAAAAPAGGGTSMVAPGIPAVAGTGGGLTAPATAALGGVAPTAAAAGGGGALKKVADILGNPATQVALAATLPLALGMGPGGGGNNNAAIPAELQRYLGLSEARIRRADPLHQAAVQMAWEGLPTYGRQGITPTKVPLP